jgi:hypothetical protein
MPQPNLSAVKIIAEEVARGNMSVKDLASCILILIDEMGGLKEKVEGES